MVEQLRPGLVRGTEFRYEYGEGLIIYLNSLINWGIITFDQAQKILTETAKQVKIEGISPNLPYYKEAVAGTVYQPEPKPSIPEPTPPTYRPERKLPKMKPMPPAEGVYTPFLEKFPAATMRQYYERRMPQIYREFEAEQPGARGRWRSFMAGIGFRGGRAPYGQERGVTMGGRRMRGAAEMGRIRRERWAEMAERGEEIPELKDPWAKYLEAYPFLQKFMALPRRERGFYPATFKPPTRWLTY